MAFRALSPKRLSSNACNDAENFCKTSAGNYNGGRFSDATLDGMIGQIKVEMDAAKRDALLAQALQRVKDGYYYIPLHHQIRPWAMRKNVETPHRADDRPMPTWTTIK